CNSHYVSHFAAFFIVARAKISIGRSCGTGYGATSVWVGKTGNDPSAGSPTETLLRLLLPLNDKVRTASRGLRRRSPGASPDHSIGRSDGRCVQRAGT
ncbi:hypothetical protein EMIHUDRAFT_76581, partial [Emiliania huxleyi CCMP1516]